MDEMNQPMDEPLAAGGDAPVDLPPSGLSSAAPEIAPAEAAADEAPAAAAREVLPQDDGGDGTAQPLEESLPQPTGVSAAAP